MLKIARYQMEPVDMASHTLMQASFFGRCLSLFTASASVEGKMTVNLPPPPRPRADALDPSMHQPNRATRLRLLQPFPLSSR